MKNEDSFFIICVLKSMILLMLINHINIQIYNELLHLYVCSKVLDNKSFQ